MAGINIDDPDDPVDITSVLDSGENVYSSEDYLYIATSNYINSGWLISELTTTVHKFKLDNGKVSYVDKGEVKGRVLNQFSMDQYGEYFRIATTSDEYDARGWYVSTNNNLYVLDGGMRVIGALEDLAPGEVIYSVRFMGERAYIVTFKTVDPLFVISLKDPRKPELLGALKIPGYSDYLHPYDENHIIGFGKDTVEIANKWSGGESVTAYYQGMKMAIFDVSDVTNPIEKFTTNIGDRGTDSELLRNHKALLFSKERELLAFPVTVMTVPERNKTGNPINDSLLYGQFEFQGAYVYNINLESGFTLRGKITHLSAQDYLKAGSYWYDSDKNIERLLYIRESLFSLSKATITANNLSDLKETGRLNLK